MGTLASLAVSLWGLFYKLCTAQVWALPSVEFLNTKQSWTIVEWLFFQRETFSHKSDTLQKSTNQIVKTLPVTVSEPFIHRGSLDWLLGRSTGYPSVTIPGSIRVVWTQHLGNGSVLNTAVLGEWLDLMMLEVFSILNDPMILPTHLHSVWTFWTGPLLTTLTGWITQIFTAAPS